MTMQTLSKE